MSVQNNSNQQAQGALVQNSPSSNNTEKTSNFLEKIRNNFNTYQENFEYILRQISYHKDYVFQGTLLGSPYDITYNTKFKLNEEFKNIVNNNPKIQSHCKKNLKNYPNGATFEELLSFVNNLILDEELPIDDVLRSMWSLAQNIKEERQQRNTISKGIAFTLLGLSALSTCFTLYNIFAPSVLPAALTIASLSIIGVSVLYCVVTRIINLINAISIINNEEKINELEKQTELSTKKLTERMDKKYQSVINEQKQITNAIQQGARFEIQPQKDNNQEELNGQRLTSLKNIDHKQSRSPFFTPNFPFMMNNDVNKKNIAQNNGQQNIQQTQLLGRPPIYPPMFIPNQLYPIQGIPQKNELNILNTKEENNNQPNIQSQLLKTPIFMQNKMRPFSMAQKNKLNTTKTENNEKENNGQQNIQQTKLLGRPPIYPPFFMQTPLSSKETLANNINKTECNDDHCNCKNRPELQNKQNISKEIKIQDLLSKMKNITNELNKTRDKIQQNEIEQKIDNQDDNNDEILDKDIKNINTAEQAAKEGILFRNPNFSCKQNDELNRIVLEEFNKDHKNTPHKTMKEIKEDMKNNQRLIHQAFNANIEQNRYIKEQQEQQEKNNANKDVNEYNKYAKGLQKQFGDKNGQIIFTNKQLNNNNQEENDENNQITDNLNNNKYPNISLSDKLAMEENILREQAKQMQNEEKNKQPKFFNQRKFYNKGERKINNNLDNPLISKRLIDERNENEID